MSSPVKRHVLLITAVAAISTAAILIRVNSGPPLAIAGWRLGLATAFLTPWALRRRRELAALDRRAAIGLAGAAAALALHFALWITSLGMTSVASAVTLVCLQPIFALAGEAILGTRIRPAILLPVFLAILGASVLAGFDGGSLPGDLLALAGAAAIAVYWLFGRSLRPRLGLTVYTWTVYGLAAVLLLSVAAARGDDLAPRTSTDLASLVLLALLPTLAGHSIFNWALREVSATTVSVYILGEPVGAAILAALLLGEVPGPRVITGCLIVLAGLYWFARWNTPCRPSAARSGPSAPVPR